MGERMRQGTDRARARRGMHAGGWEQREEIVEREGERGSEWEEERGGRMSRGVPAGLTTWERLALRGAMEGWTRLVAEQMGRGLSEGRAGWWLMDEIRALAAAMAAAMDGAAEERPAGEGRAAPGGRDGRDEVLTRRELEVLGLAAQGMKGPAIARALSLSKDTVHTHQTRTCAKLGVSGTAAAVAKARELGLI